jgi:flagellar motor switch protein FliM
MGPIEPGKVLSQAEVDALLSAISTGEVAVAAEEPQKEQVVLYDFRRPERVARDQLRAISTMHDVFARNFQAFLSGTLRSIADVRVQGVDQLTFSEFINSLPNPTVFCILAAEPLEGSFILELNPVVAFPILERMLGSSRGAASPPERPLTDLEWALMEKVVHQALSLLSEAWAKVAELRFRLTGRESNPHLVPIMSSNEPVVSIVFDITLGEARGFMNLCVPVVSIEGLLEKISAQRWFGTPRREAGTAAADRAVAKQIGLAEVGITSILAQTTMRLEEVRRLAVGDCVATDHPTHAPIIVCVEGRPKFWASPCAVKDRVAVRIVRLVTPDEARQILRQGV